MEYKIVTTSRNGQALYFQKQLYYKLQPKDPVTGVIRWRCRFYHDSNYRCKTILKSNDSQVLSINSQHEKHTEVKESQVLMMNAKQQVKENVAKNKGPVKKTNPNVVVSDFETAAINAFRNNFQKVLMKGCHFHYTQALWKNIQKVGLVGEYGKMDAIYDWLNMFKSLAFLRPDCLESAWQIIQKFRPSNNPKLIEFHDYFKDTWYQKPKFSYELWNHYYTEGPRTNNHVEGYNLKINKYIDYSHPHIYSAINTLKCLETSTGLNFFQIESGGLTQFPRRTRDIQRDVMKNYLKGKFERGELTVIMYLNRMSTLFRFDKSNKKHKLVIPDGLNSSAQEKLLPTISIFKISNQSYNFIKTYQKSKICLPIVILCHYPVLRKWRCFNGTSLYTTGNGDCLYNAISLALYGNESNSKKIKLSMVFIMFEYEDYFRNLVESFKYSDSFEKKVIDASTLGIFGNEFNMIALSLLFLRPIKCYSLHNIAFNVNTSQMSGYPIYLSLKDVHFTPIVPLNQNFQIADTTGDHLNFIKYGVGDLDFY
ncbi:unnamed protein product [Brachionus calyciflorus]|uniref:OTU domain-containing protein n=1 Tax=Brachionus calyciflorus TaxID=104777 RepID=A0A814I4L8_9BILA|nr:unnamed protein product [Brachionus calyciflorus]